MSEISTVNGDHKELNQPNDDTLTYIIEALEVIYNSRSPNDIRQAASSYLDGIRRHAAAQEYGVRLAGDKAQATAIRHFGLSMIESMILHDWDHANDTRLNDLRRSVIELAKQIDEDDPAYLVRKIGQLWIEIAKITWAADWTNMDEELRDLWDSSLEKKIFVLYVLETLSEEVFNEDDATAGLRGHDLGKACVEIFTPAFVLHDHYPARTQRSSFRSGEDGWLFRLCDLIGWCLANGCGENTNVKRLTIETLSSLRAAVSWMMPRAICTTQTISILINTLSVVDIEIRRAVIEALFVIYRRQNFGDDDFRDIVCPMFTHNSVSTLRDVFICSEVDIYHLDDSKYLLRKKTSELMSFLGKMLEHDYFLIPPSYETAGFLALMFDVARDSSLVVSIPVLHVWSRILRVSAIFESRSVAHSINGLLEVCSQRLVRYESLPTEYSDVTTEFLNEDIDTIPERHAFLGNYRRYCMDIVEVIVRKVPVDALSYILSQVERLIWNIHETEPNFQPSAYVKNSLVALRVDAQATVVEAALKGYLKWSAQLCDDPQTMEKDRHRMEDIFEQWCKRVSEITIKDPDICKKLVQLQVTFATKTLARRPGFAVDVLNYILSQPNVDDVSFPAYSDAIKNLQYVCTVEAQRLAMAFPDHFLAIYDELERKISNALEPEQSDDRQRLGYMSFLFVIIHRSTKIDGKMRQERLERMLRPISESWQNEELAKSLTSFEKFCEMLGVEQLPSFLSERNFHEIEDWGSQQMDDEGQRLQAALMKRFQQLPLRATKFLIGASTEGVKDNSTSFDVTCSLWGQIIPKVLPNLLQLISHAQAFSDMERWSHLPQNLQVAMKRVLTDRFWQAGISAESKDEFYARVGGTKSTFDGFASTVRGILRQIREAGYFILYGMSRLKEHFYGISDLPVPLAHALYGNAHVLSTHHFGVLLSMSTPLIQMCPQNLRSHFLPPVLSTYFDQINKKISREWDAINRSVGEPSSGGELDDEMKAESILRQVTFAAISSVLAIIDPQHATFDTISPKEAPVKSFILTNHTILEPLFILCKTVLGVRDARCCSLAIRSIRQLVYAFDSPSSVRDFLTGDMLKAAIVALHEPHLVDVHKELAGLIALLIRLDPAGQPRSVMLSLPGMAEREEKVDRTLHAISEARSERQQRSLVLDLLASVRGVSIHELGKIERPARKTKSAVQEQYMSVDAKPAIVRGGSPDLAGVAEIFQ